MTVSALTHDENQIKRTEAAPTSSEAGQDRSPINVDQILSEVETVVTNLKHEVAAAINEVGGLAEEALGSLDKCLSTFRTKAGDFLSLRQAEAEFLETRRQAPAFEAPKSREYLNSFFGEVSSTTNVSSRVTAAEMANQLRNLTLDSTVKNYRRTDAESPEEWHLVTLPNGNVAHLEFTYSERSYEPGGRLLEKISLRPVRVRDGEMGVEPEPGQARLELIFDTNEQRMLAVVKDGNGDTAGRLHPEVFLDLFAKLSAMGPATKIAQTINYAEMDRVSLEKERREMEDRRTAFEEAGLKFVLDDHRTDPQVRVNWRRFRVQDSNGETVKQFESTADNDPNVVMSNFITGEGAAQLIDGLKTAPTPDT